LQKFQAYVSNVRAFLSSFRCYTIDFDSFGSNIGLPPYLPPLPPSKPCVSGSSCKRKEICNDREGFITGHWILGLIFCTVGIGCCAQSFRKSGFAPTFSDFAHYAGYQLLFVVFFSLGSYAIISTTFKDCDQKANYYY
jgi:hypothetical protein